MACGEFTLVGQLPADQRRGRHGRRSAEQRSALNWLSQPHQHQGQWRGDSDHLQAAGRQYGFTGKPEVPEGELQPNHEQQQGHAQLGQKIKRFSRRDHAGD